jgi:hypothetical protein
MSTIAKRMRYLMVALCVPSLAHAQSSNEMSGSGFAGKQDSQTAVVVGGQYSNTAVVGQNQNTHIQPEENRYPVRCVIPSQEYTGDPSDTPYSITSTTIATNDHPDEDVYKACTEPQEPEGIYVTSTSLPILDHN